MKPLFFLAVTAVICSGQTEVTVLASGLHGHYLFNSSYTYDSVDYSSLPWTFYYGNANSIPSNSGQRRSRCSLSQVNGTPYGRANYSWFEYGPYGPVTPSANGSYPYAPPGEYLSSESFGNYNGNPSIGFNFTGEFGGTTTSTTPTPSGNATTFFVETVYFTDRECSDGGTEYGWYRFPAVASTFNSALHDEPADVATFYYSNATNCNIDFMCWDTNGLQVFQNTVTAKVTNIPLTSNQNRIYKFSANKVVNPSGFTAGTYFRIQIKDPSTSGVLSGCSVAMAGPGISTSTASGSCDFYVPVASWYPISTISAGNIVAATQSSRPYNPPYYTNQGDGALPPSSLSSLAAITVNSVKVLY